MIFLFKYFKIKDYLKTQKLFEIYYIEMNFQ